MELDAAPQYGNGVKMSGPKEPLVSSEARLVFRGVSEHSQPCQKEPTFSLPSLKGCVHSRPRTKSEVELAKAADSIRHSDSNEIEESDFNFEKHDEQRIAKSQGTVPLSSERVY
jgi:hypothetical protein